MAREGDDDMSERKTLNTMVTCDDPNYRSAIGAVLELLPEISVIARRPEGVEGVDHVRRTNPDLVILGVAPDENWDRHIGMYQDAFDGPIVGFAFDDAQREAYKRCGVQEVVDGDDCSDDLRAAIHRAAAAHGLKPEPAAAP